MKYHGYIETVSDDTAWGVIFCEENKKQFITIPLPENWNEFNIKEGVELIMLDGDHAKHEDGSITPIIILTRRDKSLILQMREEEDKSLTVISGTICDKEAIDNSI